MNFNYLRSNFGEDEDFIVELLCNMLPDIDLKIKELEKSVLQNNPDQCHHLIHNLKTSMEMIDLGPLINHLQEIDKEARLGKDLSVFIDNVHKITTLWEIGRAEIMEYIENKARQK